MCGSFSFNVFFGFEDAISADPNPALCLAIEN